MTATTTHLDPSPTNTDDGPDISHIYCHNPNRSLCGEGLTNMEESDGTKEQHCVVCVDLEKQPCKKCGE